MKYKILVSYQTGDSISSSDQKQEIELDWEDIDVAKENLNRIKEHYEMYRSIRYGGFNQKVKPRQEIFQDNINKPWFVNSPKLYCISSGNAITEKDKKKVGDGNWHYQPDPHNGEYCLKLITDKGKDFQLLAFWCGHFERLHEIEIIADKTDMKIEFY
jgi:hypothetical protein